MKRSGQVGLVLMGAATFVATFAAGTAYFAWQKPSHAAQPVQECTPRDGTQNCQPTQRGFAYYLYPRYFSGWSWSGSSTAEQTRTQSAALTSNSRSYAPAANSGTVRGGFGSTAGSAPFRVSAGG